VVRNLLLISSAKERPWEKSKFMAKEEWTALEDPTSIKGTGSEISFEGTG
jgi:hypothetical protein